MADLGLGAMLHGGLSWTDLVRLRADPAFRWLNSHVVNDIASGGRNVEQAMLVARFEPNADRATAGTLDVLVSRAWRIHDRIGALLRDAADGAVSQPDAEPRRRGWPAPSSSARPRTEGEREHGKARTVFLIHGRDTLAAQDMRSFLRAIGLEVIEWDQAARLTGQTNPYVMDIVRTALETALAAVVLFTPDEKVEIRSPIAKSDDDVERGYQSRPNVWLEAGMALGMFPGRTVLVETDGNRPASDLTGLLFAKVRETDSTSRTELAERLQLAGCEVNLTGRRDYLRQPLRYTPLPT